MDFKKLKVSPVAPEADDRTPVEVIVRVKRSKYVPKEISVRTQIDNKLFTAETTLGVVKLLRSDPKVADVEISERLRLIE